MKLQSIIRPGPEVLAAQHAITGTPAYTELLRCVGRALAAFFPEVTPARISEGRRSLFAAGEAQKQAVQSAAAARQRCLRNAGISSPAKVTERLGRRVHTDWLALHGLRLASVSAEQLCMLCDAFALTGPACTAFLAQNGVEPPGRTAPDEFRQKLRGEIEDLVAQVNERTGLRIEEGRRQLTDIGQYMDALHTATPSRSVLCHITLLRCVAGAGRDDRTLLACYANMGRQPVGENVFDGVLGALVREQRLFAFCAWDIGRREGRPLPMPHPDAGWGDCLQDICLPLPDQGAPGFTAIQAFWINLARVMRIWDRELFFTYPFTLAGAFFNRKSEALAKADAQSSRKEA